MSCRTKRFKLYAHIERKQKSSSRDYSPDSNHRRDVFEETAMGND